MIANVGADIEIIDCTPEMEHFLRRKLTFDNPEYYQKLDRGLWLGNTPEQLTLVQREGRNIRVPFGVLPDIFKMYGKFDRINDNCKAPLFPQFMYWSDAKLYNYQETAVLEALKKRQGIIVAPCGSGKTQIGLKIAARLGVRTLWLTHTHDLLNQSMSRAKADFKALQDSDYGTITNGKVDCGNVITFATVQTMANIDLSNLRDFWDCVIVDECHHCVGTPTKMMMFYKILSQLNARYKYGLTATPKRADGLTDCMFAIIGPVAYEVSREAVVQNTCPVKIVKMGTCFMPSIDRIIMPDGTISYQKLISEICDNDVRNCIIVEQTRQLDGSCLMLSERVRHCEVLAEMLGDQAMCLTGAKTPKKEREKMLSALANGKKKYLVSTYQLAKEGLDIPSLRNLVFATPQKNETVVTQSIGRVERKAPGKTHGIVYDYVDDFSVLRKWSSRRDRIYKRLGYDVALHTP